MANSIMLILGSFIAGFLISWIIRKLIFEKDHIAQNVYSALEKQFQQLALEKGILESDYNQMKKSEEKSKIEFDQKIFELGTNVKAIAELQAANVFLKEKLDTQKEEVEQIGQKFEKEFKLLAGSILDEKTKSFNVLQETSLKSILDPLKTNIKDFKEEFEKKLNNEAWEKGSLSEQIKQMMDLNRNLSTQADNLTKALSNNIKQQGDWGEGILESILQYTGLQKDIQYFVQQSSRNDDGDIIRPDVIVKYPDGRALVIDSKVSLLHHTQYCAAETPEEQALSKGQIVNSFKQHINGLSGNSA